MRNPKLLDLTNKLLWAQKVLMEATINLENLRLKAPVSDELFMATVKPLYDAGLGDLLESTDIDQLRRDLTGVTDV